MGALPCGKQGLGKGFATIDQVHDGEKTHLKAELLQLRSGEALYPELKNLL